VMYACRVRVSCAAPFPEINLSFALGSVASVLGCGHGPLAHHQRKVADGLEPLLHAELVVRIRLRLALQQQTGLTQVLDRCLKSVPGLKKWEIVSSAGVNTGCGVY